MFLIYSHSDLSKPTTHHQHEAVDEQGYGLGRNQRRGDADRRDRYFRGRCSRRSAGWLLAHDNTSDVRTTPNPAKREVVTETARPRGQSIDSNACVHIEVQPVFCCHARIAVKS